MNKKDIKKIIIPAIAIIVIIGGLVVYFAKPQEVQPVMAPLDTEQDLVEEKEEIPEEPQEDTATDNNEVEFTGETEETTIDDGINSTHTDITLSEDEYQGDDGVTTTGSDDLTPEEQAMLDEIEQQVMREHSEWFTDTNPNKGTGNGNQGNTSNVGTPDSGVIPEFDMNSVTSDVPGGTVY